MRATLATAREGLTGVVEMLAGRTDFHQRFDISGAGVARSFAAALMAIPFWAFALLVQGALAARSADPLEAPPEPVTLAYAAARWVAVWAYFPLLAAVVTRILGRPEGFAPWVVVHNWTHLLIVLIQAVPFALVASGAVELGSLLYVSSLLIMAYAYACAARAALDVPWHLAIPAGAANLAAMLLVDAGLREVL